MINIKDITGVCGRHLRESGKLQQNRVVYYLYLQCALQQPPNKMRMHTLTLRDAGAEYGQHSQLEPRLPTCFGLQEICLIIVDFYLVVYSVLLEEDM